MQRLLGALGALLIALPALAGPVQNRTSVAGEVTDLRLGRSQIERELTPSAHVPIPAWAFTFDDGDTSYLTYVAICDSIADARGWEGDDKLRGTTSIMVSQVEAGTASLMSWAQLATLDRYQHEVALHGNSEERFGSLQVGFSRHRADSMLADWTARQRENLGYSSSGIVAPNHRQTHALVDTYLDNGITWMASLRVPVNADTSGALETDAGSPLDNEQSPMDVNYDPWPQYSANNTSTDFACYIRPGGVTNRWNIARRASWRRADDTVQDIKDVMSLAVQTNSIAILTFHTIADDAATLSIDRADMISILDYAADLIDLGMGRSITMSEAVSRGTGYVVGRLNPHWNFTRIDDIDPSNGLDGNPGDVPISWPLFQGAVGSYSPFYIVPNDTFSVVGSNVDQWKVIDGAVNDTVLTVFTAEFAADSVSYGASSDTSRVLVARAPAASNGRTGAIPIIIRTTGVRSDHVEIAIHGMSYGGDSDDHFPAVRLFQWDEVTGDYVNQGAAAYDFTMFTAKVGAPDSTNWEPQRVRIRPQFLVNVFDIAWDTPWRNTGTYASDTSREITYFSLPLCRPFIYEDQGSIDIKSPFGNYADLAADGNAGDRHFDNIPPATKDRVVGTSPAVDHGRAHWITYLYRIEIAPLRTDWVGGYVYFRHDTDAPLADIEWILSDVAAWAPF